MGDEFNEKEIKELMEKLSKKRPVFDSEDDFKFSLAWEIKEKYRDHVEIRLEKKMNNNKNASSLEEEDQNNKNERIDIFIIVKNENYMEKIGIELKYFTAEIEWRDNENDETFKLANQAAYNIKCYDAWKDVERLENFIDKGFINKGFIIWLTNVKSLTDKDDFNRNNYYYEFRIRNGRKIPDENNPRDPEKGYVELKWNKDASEGTKKGREDPIRIKKNYNVSWNEYSILNLEDNNSHKKISNNIFKYALLEIPTY